MNHHVQKSGPFLRAAAMHLIKFLLFGKLLYKAILTICEPYIVYTAGKLGNIYRHRITALFQYNISGI